MTNPRRSTPRVRRLRHAGPASLVLAALLIALGGCGESDKSKDCRALVGVINDGVDKVQKGLGGGADAGAAVAELRAFADEMDTIAKTGGALKLTTPTLQKHAEEYQTMVTEVAAAARELATAVDKVDGERKTKALKRMSLAVKQEDPIVEGINKFCKPE